MTWYQGERFLVSLHGESMRQGFTFGTLSLVLNSMAVDLVNVPRQLPTYNQLSTWLSTLAMNGLDSILKSLSKLILAWQHPWGSVSSSGKWILILTETRYWRVGVRIRCTCSYKMLKLMCIEELAQWLLTPSSLILSSLPSSSSRSSHEDSAFLVVVSVSVYPTMSSLRPLAHNCPFSLDMVSALGRMGRALRSCWTVLLSTLFVSSDWKVWMHPYLFPPIFFFFFTS